MTAVCALILAATLSVGPDPEPATQEPGLQAAQIAAAVSATPALDGTVEPWMLDRKMNRPRPLGLLYGTLGSLQALDIYSTYRSLRAGGREVNPVVRDATSSPAAMIAIKSASTAAAIYFAERAWKSNRKGAVILMAVVNGVTAAVVANNLRHSRRGQR